MANNRIEIMGPMGCGKTTLARAFEQAGIQTVYEKVEQNPYLHKFYQDPPRFAFEKDMFFVIDFMHQAKSSDQAAQPVVFDYSMYGNLAYIEAGAQGADTQSICRGVAKAAFEQIGRPALTIYLDCPPPELAARIAARARSMEETVPLAYLEGLKRAMDKQADDVARHGRLHRIDVVRADVRDPAQSAAMAAKALRLIGR